jgi:hypothetical protein
MAKEPQNPNDQSQPEQQVHPGQNDATEVIPQRPEATVRMPSVADVPPAPDAGQAPTWVTAVDGAAAAPRAAANAAPAPAAGAPVPPAQVPPAAAAPATGGPWWKGRLAVAGAALAAGLLLGGAVGAASTAAIGDGDGPVRQAVVRHND